MSLCGMKSESRNNWISYHHNWFDHSDSKHLRIRTMSVHVYNNYFDGNSKYGVGVTSGEEAFVENNYFRNCKYPMLISRQGTDGTGKGTFSGESGGMIKSYGNYIEGEKAYVKYSSSNSIDFDAYEASSRDEEVPSSIKAKDGGSTYSNFDTDSSIMYEYTPLDAKDVPFYVKEKAGRILGGDFTINFPPEDDKDDGINTELMAKLRAYKTDVISIGSGITEGEDEDHGDDKDEEKKEINNKVTHNFSSDGLNSEYFEIDGILKQKDELIYDELTLSVYLKLESSTYINFTVTKESELTIVTDSMTTNFNLDGKKINTDDNGVTTVTIKPGKHSITKANTGNIYYISVE